MKKFLAMALAAVMVLALAACGSKNDTADDTGDTQDAQGGETQKLIVGFDAEFPPFGFIAADGTIRSIHSNAVPYSTDPIPSKFPVRAVLEINGGSARMLGIKPGDKVKHPIFGNG